MKRLVGLIVIILFILAFSLLLVVAGESIVPGRQVRWLARVYLNTSYNPWSPYFTVNSPESVTSVVWDYRGLDTVFETMVFYLAIIGSIALARGYRKYIPAKLDYSKLGLSIIVKTVTRITAPLIIIVAASIALHGHLTPGGGFQGGATGAVAPLLILIIFSQYYLIRRGVRKESMLIVRSLGLTGIGITAIAVFLAGLAADVHAYVLQNQAKATAPVSAPAYIDNQLISGTLWFFNIFEFFAVLAGFTIVLLLLTIPEKAYQDGGVK